MNSRPSRWIPAALAVAACLAPPGLARGEEDDTWLARARDLLAANDALGGIEISGETNHVGLPAEFRLTLGAGGCFRLAVEGRAPRTRGFDGTDAWEVDGASPAYPLVLLHRERALVTTWIWSGQWASEDAPFDLRAVEQGSDGSTHVKLQLVDGLLHADLVLSGENGLPSGLVFPETFGGGALRFDDWREGDQGTYPWLITWAEPTGQPMVYETSAIRALDADAGLEHAFSAPIGPGADTTFDTDRAPGLELRRAGRGHLFVRPKINGREVGWFLFDSGAGSTIITQAAADELELPSFGEVAVSGMGGPPSLRPLRQSETIEIGPLTMHGLVLSETASMGMADQMLGEPCAGALGWDVFLRAVVEIDPSSPDEPSVSLLDPTSYTSGEGRWEDVTLHWKVPYIRARFEGEREGLFCIDTGAGGTGVLFHSLAARTLNLLDGREGESLSGRGAGGSFEMRQIELAWFEVAGNRVEPAQALASVGEDGEADPYAYGFLGSGFLGPYRLVFDYSRRRMGFLER